MLACLLLPALASPIIDKIDNPTRDEDSRLAEPVAPLQDPWYTAPHRFEDRKPGTVLRIREAPGNLTSLFNNCSTAYNILYRTTNDRYKPDWAVTTVLVPDVNAPALLSYQIPYDSAYLDASPSYALYSNADNYSEYRVDISIGLSDGWFVNIPDYEGPLASFTAGVQAGHATIDSIRAVLSVHKKLGLAEGARYAMWGYSGGALASEWAAELQVQYAPELNFSGAALGGLAPNTTSTLFTINRSSSVGLAAVSLSGFRGLSEPTDTDLLNQSSYLGATSQYPEGREYLLSRLRTSGPYNATGFLAALNYTLGQAHAAYAYQDIGDYFIGGIDDLVSVVPRTISNRNGILGYHGVPQMPLFVYKAIVDEISVVEDTDSLVAEYCKSESRP